MNGTMKQSRRITLSVILVLCMLFSLCAPIGALDMQERNGDAAVQYLALGMTNDHTGDGNWFTRLTGMLGADVDADLISGEGMRAEEYAYLLSETYMADRFAEQYFYVNDPDFAQTKADAQRAVAQAELITLDLGGANFGSYLAEQIGEGTYRTDFDVIGEASPVYLAAKEEIFKILDAYASAELALLSDETLDDIIGVIAYAFTGFCTAHDEAVRAVRALNPETPIVVLPVRNTLDAKTVIPAGTVCALPMDTIGDALAAAANTALAASVLAGEYTVAQEMDDMASSVCMTLDTGAAFGDDIMMTVLDMLAKYESNPRIVKGIYPTCTSDPVYTALGGAVTAGDGLGRRDSVYADIIAEMLETSLVNFDIEKDYILAANKKLNSNLLADYIAANASDIMSATVITYQMDATGILNVLLDGSSFVDWDRYLPQETVDALLERARAEFVFELPAELAPMIENMLETIVYAALSYAEESVRAFESIRALNPNALILAVGMYNPLAGMTVVSGGEALEIGDMFGLAIDVANLLYALYADLSGDITYVPAPDVELKGTIHLEIGETPDISALIPSLMKMTANMFATVEGHSYIADCIADAIVFAEHSEKLTAMTPAQIGVDGSAIYTCSGCGASRSVVIPALTEPEPEPEIPETPDEPEIPDTPDEPEIPDTPDEPEIPDTPDEPEIPDTPDEPEVPAVPDEPDPIVPPTPIVPADPVVPDTPAEPESYTCDGGDSCPSKVFDDLDTTMWYHLGIDVMLKRRVMVGVEEGVFAPAKTITRAEAAVMLWRLEGAPAFDMEQAESFSDVPVDEWYAEAVAWASVSGMLFGYDDGTFGPADGITREQLASLMYRYAYMSGHDVALEDGETLASFVDEGEISAWANSAVKWAVDRELLRGTSSDRLSPLGSATRAEVAAIFHRFTELYTGGSDCGCGVDH